MRAWRATAAVSALLRCVLIAQICVLIAQICVLIAQIPVLLPVMRARITLIRPITTPTAPPLHAEHPLRSRAEPLTLFPRERRETLAQRAEGIPRGGARGLGRIRERLRHHLADRRAMALRAAGRAAVVRTGVVRAGVVRAGVVRAASGASAVSAATACAAAVSAATARDRASRPLLQTERQVADAPTREEVTCASDSGA